ncbi:DMT family transporter [Roseofilum capinflatum]|uniref:DMT family transporter n=1 Tax=Roseofilum capinflatum BLCC-M114 TaxID=3022440 RepID=A0ABT7BBG8_9CYAN|nr:DMT family transporter [Roseofilum capinflatum]MDJ1176501.1 DMT family transporter [Roseofilum capinflatum BLCC-M114]
MTQFITLLVVAAVGISVTVQAQAMGILEQKLGVFDNIVITYGGGGLLILAIALLRTLFAGYTWSNYGLLPGYAIVPGICGLVIVGGIAYCVSQVGLLATFSLSLAVQFALGSLLDTYGIGLDPRPMTLSRYLGVGLVLAGAILFLKK